LFLAIALGLRGLIAAQLPAEQLLPAETIAMLTVKDWSDASNAFFKTAPGLLWNDEAMRGVREKFNARLTNEVSNPTERELKIKLSDYAELVQGQITLAMTLSATEGKAPGFLLLIDAKDKSDALKSRLEDLRKKWSEGDRKFKAEKIRDVEFTSYEFTQAALQKVMNALSGGKPEDIQADPEAEKNKTMLMVGQSQSLLIVGTQARDIEKILTRQNGGAAPSLGEQPVFLSNFNSVFRDSTAFGWVDFKPVFEQMLKPTEKPAPGAPAGGIGNLRIEKVLPALGLGELKSIAFKVALKPEGIDGQMFLTVPESARAGLLKILAPPAKDASPPPFVPGDVVKFRRVRIDFQQAWTAFEGVLIKIDPSIAGLVQLMLSAAGKDKDPDFDLKKSLLESVGDDLIMYEKAEKNGVTPSLTLIGARSPGQLMNCVKMIMRMLPEPIGTTPLKEREFLGRKIFTLTMAPGGGPGTQMHFAGNGNYLAVSSDAGILEDYLRASEPPPKTLRDLPGFTDTAQKVGGFNTGWYSFENMAETMRATVESMKAPKPPQAPSAFQLNPIPDESQRIKDWIDPASLPPFERIAKYFYYSVLSGSSTPEGISFKLSMPTAPGLK
jgi:hypothetical protein